MPDRATSTRLIVVLIATPALFSCGGSREMSSAPPPPPPSVKAPAPAADDMVIRPNHRVRWSKVLDPETFRALKEGRRRLVISVSAYEPPTPGPAAFVVYLIPSKGANRLELDRFEVLSDAPFRVSNGVEPHRFLIDLTDHAPSLEDSRLDLEVAFDPAAGKLQGGLAEVSFEFVELK
jgi:hypothetical protein